MPSNKPQNGQPVSSAAFLTARAATAVPDGCAYLAVGRAHDTEPSVFAGRRVGQRVWLCPLPAALEPACLLEKEVCGPGSAKLAAHLGRFFPAGHAQFPQQVGDVDAGGLLADEQDVADLAVGAPFGDEVEYFCLAFGQAEPAEGLVRDRPGR